MLKKDKKKMGTCLSLAKVLLAMLEIYKIAKRFPVEEKIRHDIANKEGSSIRPWSLHPIAFLADRSS